jgi:hypothetical protein
MMKLKSILFGLSALLAVSATTAAPISISSGVASWQVNGNPAIVETTIATPAWINNFGDGKWVGVTANSGSFTGGEAPGTYVFTFNLGSLGNGTFNIDYAADNSVTWTITGGTLSGATTCTSGNPDTSNCFGASNSAPRSLTGTFSTSSVLTATILNGSSPGFDPNPMGLLVVGTAAVPVPASLALFAVGGLVLVASRKRKNI